MVFIRKVDVSVITQRVKELCIDANCRLGDDVILGLKDAVLKEKSPVGRQVVDQLLENASIAGTELIPMCQDTGFAVIFLEIGQEVALTGGNLISAVNKGVSEGYTEGFLRKSIVKNPLERVNTGDNTPAIIHIELVPGDRITVTVAPKGGGSENMSALRMLKPSDGIAGVKQFVVETVKNAGSNPCPPVIVGVGIGGTMEKAALMAKHSLTRSLGESSSDPDSAKLEMDLLNEINHLGIGPQGIGGTVTALAVHVEMFATHIACLPVAVNIGCHAYRHKTAII